MWKIYSRSTSSKTTLVAVYRLGRSFEQNTRSFSTKSFLEHGEISFRKLEKTALDDLLASAQVSVLSLGGGTPCYADNMQSVIQSTPLTFYLSTSISTLCNRLFLEKDHRPMISHLTSKEKLKDFIAKHIHERKMFYEQANHLMYLQDETPQELVNQIIEKLY